jgi:hypothetical protein
VSRLLLDSDLIGPENDIYERIEIASGEISKPASRIVGRFNGKLHWSWGDSKGWRLIIGFATEAELARLISSPAANKLAAEIIEVLGDALVLDPKFKLYIELDSDERVNANEGWFFRMKSDPQPGRELTFNNSGERLSLARDH